MQLLFHFMRKNKIVEGTRGCIFFLVPNLFYLDIDKAIGGKL